MASLFEPEWLPKGPSFRFGVGLELGCPVHIGCRVRLFFVNPVDGMPPSAPSGSQLYYRTGSGLGSLSLTPEVDVGEHGQFQILRGKVVFRLQ
jgi:hypothetical protein